MRLLFADKHVCGDDWGVAFSILTNMTVALVNLLRKGERTLKEVRERCAAMSTETAIKLEYRKKTCRWTGVNVQQNLSIIFTSIRTFVMLCGGNIIEEEVPLIET